MFLFAVLPATFFNVAIAQDNDTINTRDLEIRDRDYLMQTNVRYRNLFVPDALMDTWFYNSDTEGAYSEPRPSIGATVIGLEYAFLNEGNTWTIWGEYMGSKLEQGYWDDIETSETVDHDDGDWVRPDNFSGWWGGFNYAYTVPLTDPNKAISLGLPMGGGLGVGYITGNLTYWRPGTAIETDCEPAAPAYVRYSVCEPDGEKEFPRFLPILDISLGLDVNFANRAHIRFEGGLHDMIYYGISAGGTF